MKKIFIRRLYIVFLLNLVLLFLIAIKYLAFLENSEGFLLKSYLFMTTLSHFCLIGVLPLLITLGVYAVTHSKTAAKTCIIMLSAFALILLAIDVTIFNQFRYHLSPIVFKLVFGKRASDIFQFTAVDLIEPVLFIIGVSVLQFLFFYLAGKVKPAANLRVKLSAAILVVCLLTSHLFYAWSDANYYQPVTQLKNLFPAFYPLTADGLLMKLDLVDEKYIARNKELKLSRSSNTVQYPLSSIISENPTKKNILFIVIDSWRGDCMTAEITPNIYRLSKNSQVFTEHMSGSNMTTGGIFSLFYGIPATYFDTFTGQEISPVMMDELQKQRYSLKIFASSTLENPPFNRNVFSGIENLRLFSNGKTSAERDLQITNEWLTSIEKPGQPFFGFLFYDSAHAFDFPPNYDLLFKPSIADVGYLAFGDDFDAVPLINRYKNSLHYVDELVGKAIESLRKKQLLESTIVVITSDHGQEFNDMKKGFWQHGGNFSKVQIHVPMIIFDAGKAPAVYKHQTLHYDVAPTILTSVLGVKTDIADYSFGQNMFAPKKRDYFVCGYNERFAFIESKRITNIYPSGLFDVTDDKLNTLDNDLVDFGIVTSGLRGLGRFYKKN
ncbi:MAG TPA: DUF3413 domain-containing protein [Flavobacterium sp.]